MVMDFHGFEGSDDGWKASEFPTMPLRSSADL